MKSFDTSTGPMANTTERTSCRDLGFALAAVWPFVPPSALVAVCDGCAYLSAGLRLVLVLVVCGGFVFPMLVRVWCLSFAFGVGFGRVRWFRCF